MGSVVVGGFFMNKLEVWEFVEPIAEDKTIIKKFGNNPEGWGYNLGEYLKGVISSIIVGLVASLGLILVSPDTFSQVYGLPAASAPIPISQPAIISVPLSLVTLIVVSLMTRNNRSQLTEA